MIFVIKQFVLINKTMGQYLTYRLNKQMEIDGRKWMPSKDKRDNKATNYNSKEKNENAYINKIKKINNDMLYYESLYDDGENIDAEAYIFLNLPIQEKLKLPDSDFMFEGMHKSLIPIICCGGRHDKIITFTKYHKDGKESKIRVPSLKKGTSTWKKFYNEFPEIGAEVRLGIRRFVNGAKLKYIW